MTIDRCALRISACLDASAIGLAVDADGTVEAVTGLVCVEPVDGCEGYGDFGDTIAAALDASSPASAPHTVTYDAVAHRWEILASAEVAWPDWTAHADARVQRLARWLGLQSADFFAGLELAGSADPWGILVPEHPVKAASTDHYQPESIWTEAEADDGSSYAVGRVSSPIYEDFRIVFETHEKTHRRIAEAIDPQPWTWQDFIDTVGAGHPFLVVGESAEVTHRMRADAARFRPVREVEDWDGAWHWPFETRVLGSRAPGVVVGGEAAPTLPTTDLLVALFANLGVTDDGAGEVTAWADQDSGSGPHDLTQTTAGDRPEIDATGGPEGEETIAFGAQSADTDGHLDFGSAVTAVASPHTYYAICNPARTSGNGFIAAFGSNAEVIISDLSGQVRMFDGSFRNFGSAVTGWQCLTFQAATTVCRAFRARSQLGTDQPFGGDNALALPACIGARGDGLANYYDGHISALLIYDREHDATERAAVWDYLASLYPSVGL